MQVRPLAHNLEEKLHQEKHSKVWLNQKNVSGRLGYSYANFPKQPNRTLHVLISLLECIIFNIRNKKETFAILHLLRLDLTRGEQSSWAQGVTIHDGPAERPADHRNSPHHTCVFRCQPWNKEAHRGTLASHLVAEWCWHKHLLLFVLKD